MPDDHVSQAEPENQSLDSATSTSHTPASESWAKPEPRSLPSQIPEATHARITWPVPHIMVYYGEIEYAYGRQAIADMGKMAFLEWMYRRLLWTPQTKYDTYRTFYFESSRFSKEARVLGTFYNIHGASDTGPVKLSALGWAEMMQNVVKLEVAYVEDEEQEHSGKQG